jgi:ADP-ribose pyrophosphatase YjhB (NUDIX family)
VCSACAFVFFLDPKIAAGVVFLRRRILLLQRAIHPSYGKWVFPEVRGPRRDTEAAALREVQEESGPSFGLTRLLGPTFPDNPSSSWRTRGT